MPPSKLFPGWWINVTPINTWAAILANTHAALGHCGQDKLLEAIREFWWWPGLSGDAAECLRRCLTCQRDRSSSPAQEALHWIDKRQAHLLGWAMDSSGPFRPDADGNKYLITAQDPFGKWAETRKTPSLRSWWAAEFLFDIIAQWCKPHYVCMDNVPVFSGTFAQLCQKLKIAHHCITMGNSKANG